MATAVRPAVGVIGSAVPIELLVAAGCDARTLLPRAADFDADCSPMEPEHEAEIRSFFVQAMRGEFAGLDLLVIAATSDGYRYLYQYLKEMVRTGRGGVIPPLYQYDLLFADSDPVRRYNAIAFAGLGDRLRALSGRAVSDDALRQACDARNAARAAVAAGVAGYRTGAVAGDALRGLVDQGRSGLPGRGAAIAGIDPASPPPGARPKQLLLLSAVTLGLDSLQRIAEGRGAVAFGLDMIAGGGAVGAIDTAAPDVAARLLDFYRTRDVSPRQPAIWHREQMQAAIASSVDGVIFYLPPEDQYFGWDYPALRAVADRAGIPALLVRDELLEPEGARAATAAIQGFVDGLKDIAA